MSMSTMTPSGETTIPNGWAGQIDSVPSLESKRPLENRAITEALNKIDNDIEKLNGMFKVANVVFDETTASANNPIDFQKELPSFYGYIPVGIIQVITASYSRVFISDYSINADNMIRLGLWNAYGVDTVIHPSAKVLYIKSEFI